MSSVKVELLKEDVLNLSKAAEHLAYSYERCTKLAGADTLSLEQLERLESLASRFARLSDLLTQRSFRLIDDFELTEPGTVLDRIQRAEKRGWLKAAHMIKIRELRNLIAREYAADRMAEIYATVLSMTPALLAVVPKVSAHAQNLINKYQAAG